MIHPIYESWMGRNSTPSGRFRLDHTPERERERVYGDCCKCVRLVECCFSLTSLVVVYYFSCSMIAIVNIEWFVQFLGVQVSRMYDSQDYLISLN